MEYQVKPLEPFFSDDSLAERFTTSFLPEERLYVIKAISGELFKFSWGKSLNDDDISHDLESGTIQVRFQEFLTNLGRVDSSSQNSRLLSERYFIGDTRDEFVITNPNLPFSVAISVLSPYNPPELVVRFGVVMEKIS
jgi:hypothetical protein